MDSTYNFTLTSQFQPSQNYKWNITTTDDFETVSPDTFAFQLQQQVFASSIGGNIFNDINGNELKILVRMELRSGKLN